MMSFNSFVAKSLREQSPLGCGKSLVKQLKKISEAQTGDKQLNISHIFQGSNPLVTKVQNPREHT